MNDPFHSLSPPHRLPQFPSIPPKESQETGRWLSLTVIIVRESWLFLLIYFSFYLIFPLNVLRMPMSPAEADHLGGAPSTLPWPLCSQAWSRGQRARLTHWCLFPEGWYWAAHDLGWAAGWPAPPSQPAGWLPEGWPAWRTQVTSD